MNYPLKKERKRIKLYLYFWVFAMSVERHINHTYFVRSIMLNPNVVLRNVSAVFGNEF